MNAVRGARWLEVADAVALAQTACRHVIDAAARAIEQRGQFVIVPAGGSTPRDAYRLLREQKADWPRWHVYFGDERCLPADNSERNSKMAADAWLDHVPIPTNQVHVIPALACRKAVACKCDPSAERRQRAIRSRAVGKAQRGLSGYLFFAAFLPRRARLFALLTAASAFTRP